MSLRGAAFLCLWNDFDRSMTEEYERWHTLEHVRERVAAPGFLAARRYGDLARAENRYLTLYDLADMAALSTPDYADLQANPTPWSARMRPHFSNVLRIPFHRIASEGEGFAAHVALLAYEIAESDSTAAEALAERLAARHDRGESVAFHVGRAQDVPAYGVFQLQADARPGVQILVAIEECTTPEAAAKSLQALRDDQARNAPDARILRAETSGFLYAVGHEEAVTRWRRQHKVPSLD
ncbi:hypothetical protein [Pararhodobacter sp. CCB-MM2]|uniref:hypothetical protein n=1 Tax=Pararhodobacter sp. CCB-MM2 TaxID=1786003 RepID=UPI000833D7DA|nr:hypothetical protein [Pararhodobacter sp. CCB-MM2]